MHGIVGLHSIKRFFNANFALSLTDKVYNQVCLSN